MDGAEQAAGFGNRVAARGGVGVDDDTGENLRFFFLFCGRLFLLPAGEGLAAGADSLAGEGSGVSTGGKLEIELEELDSIGKLDSPPPLPASAKPVASASPADSSSGSPFPAASGLGISITGAAPVAREPVVPGPIATPAKRPKPSASAQSGAAQRRLVSGSAAQRKTRR